jgi:hypothetical protein
MLIGGKAGKCGSWIDATINGLLRQVWSTQGSVFFSGEKNQKTFTYGRGGEIQDLAGEWARLEN